MLAICVNIEQVKNVIFLSLLTFQFKQSNLLLEIKGKLVLHF